MNRPRRFSSGAAATGLLILASLWCADSTTGAFAVEERFETLRLGDKVFTNAVVLNRTATDIFVQHAGGLVNVKVKDLPAETLSQLGYQAPSNSTATVQARERRPSPGPVLSGARQALGALVDQQSRWSAVRWKQRVDLSGQVPPHMAKLMAWGITAATVAVYLFLCYCSKLLVEKTGHRAGPLIWIPVLQLIPLIRAAGLSGWWLVAWLLPGLNLVAMVVWSFKIVQARRKSVVWAVLLLLPLTNLLAFLYLALSEGGPRPSRSTTILLRPAA